MVKLEVSWIDKLSSIVSDFLTKRGLRFGHGFGNFGHSESSQDSNDDNSNNSGQKCFLA